MKDNKKMESKNIDNLVFKNELVKEFVEELLNNGFQVFTSEPLHDNEKLYHFHYEKNGKIAYFEHNDLLGFNFSSVHKPRTNIGSGFGDDNNWGGWRYPSIALAKEAFGNPVWAGNYNVSKYKSIEDYFTTRTNNILKYFFITL